MSDVSLGAFSFDVNTTGLRAGSDELTRFETRINAATVALERLEARSAAAMSKVPAAMGGPPGASAAGAAQAVAGLTAQTGAATRAATAQTSLASAASAASGALNSQGAAVRSSTAAHSAHGHAVGLNANKMAELQHVIRAVSDELMAGRSLMGALGTESGRLFEIFGPGAAKVGGFLKVLGEIPLATKLAGAGMVGMGVAAAASFAEYEAQQDRLANALNGRGRLSSATVGDLQGVAVRGAAAGRISLGEATDLTARYTSAGFTPDLSGSLVGMTRDYGRVTGLGTEKGGAALEKAFADPVAGVRKLDEQFGFLNQGILQTIEDLKASGDVEGARRVELTAFGAALKATTDTTWAFSRGLGSVETWIGDRFHQAGAAVAGAFGMNSDASKLEELQRRAANLEKVDPVGNGDYIAELKREMIPLMESVSAEAMKAADQRVIAANRTSLEAGSLVDRLNPDAARYRDLQNQSRLLGDAMRDPDVVRNAPGGMSDGKLLSGSDLLADSFAKVTDRLANWMGATERSTLAINANVLGINAWTLGERLAAATAGEMASLGIRQIRTSEELVAVQAKQVDIIARANDKAYNLDRDATDKLALAGKTGLDRTIAEIHQRYNDYRDQLSDTSGGKDLEGIGATFMPAKAAATGFTAALSDATPKVEAAGDRLAKAIEGAAAKVAAASPYGALSPFKPNDAVGPFFPTPFTGRAGPVSDNERSMVDMLVRAGFTNRAADAGYVGGMAGESTTGLDPMAHNASGHRGIEQWEPSRFAGASAFGDPNTFLSQAQLAIKELQTSESAAGAMLRSATTIQGGLAANFRTERPSQAEIASSYNARLAYGTAIGADLAGLTPRAPGMAPLTVHGGSSSSSLTAAATAAANARIPTGGVLGVKLDTAGYLNSAEGKDVRGATIDATTVPLDRANTALKNQVALLDTQRDMFGQNAAAITGATRAQELWNSLVTNSAAPVGQLSKATGTLADQVRLYGSAAEKVAQQQADEAAHEKSVIDFADTTRGGASSILTSGFSSMAHGKGFGKGAASAAESFGESLMSKGVNSFTAGLLGGQGSPFGGLLGGLFGGISVPHFAGGTHDAPGGPTIVGESGPEMVEMPKGARVLTADETSAMGSARGGGHTFNLGGPTINVAGDVSEGNRAEIQRAVAAGQQQTMDHITRNFGQIQIDAGQY